MQSFLQYRRIREHLQFQVVQQSDPNTCTAYTRARPYVYQDGAIHAQARDYHADGRGYGWRRRVDVTRNQQAAAQSILPRHSLRTHLERDGDIERVDYQPDIQSDPYTINTRESMGNPTEMMVMGVEMRANTDQNEEGKMVLVTFEGEDDPLDPHNWFLSMRVLATIVVSLLTSVVLFASTIHAAALTPENKGYLGSMEVEGLFTTMYLIGLALGAMLTGPFSEVLGRNPVYIITLTTFMLFSMGSGLSDKARPQIICRFFAGVFGSAPSVAAAGSLTDLWSRVERVYAFPVYVCGAFLGAAAAPAPAGFILDPHTPVSWRWIMWMTIIFAGIVLALVFFVQPETYSPVLLHWKAKHLRRLTGDERYRAAIEFRRVTFARRLMHAMVRPIVLFATEPIIIVVSLYLAAIFMVLYTFLAGYQSIYNRIYHFHVGLVGTAFLGIAVGVLIMLPFIPLAMKLVRRDVARAKQKGLARPEPEVSLYMSMFGAPWIPISLFWMGWTARPTISFWSPLAASVLFGYGVTGVFISSYEYVADAFEFHSASALATITLVRFICGGVMAEVSYPFYTNLGPTLTLTVLGAITAALVPVPYILYRYGQQLRKWSRYAEA